MRGLSDSCYQIQENVGTKQMVAQAITCYTHTGAPSHRGGQPLSGPDSPRLSEQNDGALKYKWTKFEQTRVPEDRFHRFVTSYAHTHDSLHGGTRPVSPPGFFRLSEQIEGTCERRLPKLGKREYQR